MNEIIKKKLIKIFPDFNQKKLCEIDLNIYAKTWITKQNPSLKKAELLSPILSWKMVQEAHRENLAEWSYGGYLEDRSVLLDGGYQEKTASFIHLGVDINLPANIPVHTPFSGQVILIDDEKDYNGGWGPRVIIQPDHTSEYAMIFSHLQKIVLTNNQKIIEGALIGEIGDAPWNGNWWPHLHIQAIQARYLKQLLDTGRLLEELDGYCSRQLLEEKKLLSPDPLTIIQE